MLDIKLDLLFKKKNFIVKAKLCHKGKKGAAEDDNVPSVSVIVLCLSIYMLGICITINQYKETEREKYQMCVRYNVSLCKVNLLLYK